MIIRAISYGMLQSMPILSPEGIIGPWHLVERALSAARGFWAMAGWWGGVVHTWLGPMKVAEAGTGAGGKPSNRSPNLIANYTALSMLFT